MLKHLIALFIVLIFAIDPLALSAETTLSNQLPQCIVITHCVREEWEVADAQDSFNRAIQIISSTPRTKIVEEYDFFAHAEAQTKWRRYTDDLLIKAFPESGFLQVRSESRVGIGDNGVNQRRVDRLAYLLGIRTSS